MPSKQTASLAIIDAIVTNTPIFLRTLNSNDSTLAAASLVLNNVKLQNIPVAVGVIGGATVLPGGSITIESWVQGNIYKGTNPVVCLPRETYQPGRKPLNYSVTLLVVHIPSAQITPFTYPPQ